jgi:hypothetical protein
VSGKKRRKRIGRNLRQLSGYDESLFVAARLRNSEWHAAVQAGREEMLLNASSSSSSGLMTIM